MTPAGSRPSPAEVARARASLARAAMSVEVAAGRRIESASFGGRAGLWVSPPGGGRRGTVVLLHGGGYRAGSPALVRGLASHVAVAADVAVAVPSYRLAPEHPFPAAVHDACDAYADVVGGGPVALMGESAGAGLAAAATLSIACRGWPVPAALIGCSPWLDLTAASDSYDRNAGTDPVFDRASAHYSAACYLAGADPRDSLASPLFAAPAQLAGWPPSLLQVGAGEVLRDEAVAFAQRVRGAGGHCVLEVVGVGGHAWQRQVPATPASVAAVARIAGFLDHKLHRSSVVSA